MPATLTKTESFTLEKVRLFMQEPVARFISKEEATCYVLWALTVEDRYATEMRRAIEHEFRGLRLSDTILYSVLDCLENGEEKLIERYAGERSGRGRPTEMFRLAVPAEKVEEFTRYWMVSFGDRRRSESQS